MSSGSIGLLNNNCDGATTLCDQKLQGTGRCYKQWTNALFASAIIIAELDFSL